MENEIDPAFEDIECLFAPSLQEEILDWERSLNFGEGETDYGSD